jgi:hypothetical protein
LQKYLQQNLQLEVDKLNELTAGAPADAKLAATFNQNPLSLVSAYGLAVQAMGEGKISSSLLPQKIRREKLWRDKTKWFGATAAVVVLGTGLSLGGYYMRDLQYKSAEGVRVNNIQPVLDQATSLSTAWSNVEGNGANDRQTIQNVRSMLDGRGMWIDLLNTVFGALPPIPAGYPTDAYLKAHPRADREMIFIDKVESVYYPDVLGGLNSPPAELGLTPPAQGQQGYSDPAIPAGSRGYMITLSVTTPHHDGFIYVLNSLIANLRKFDYAAMTKWNTDNPKDQRNFCIAKVSTPMGQVQIEGDSLRLQQMTQSYAAAQLLMGIQPGSNQPNGGPMGGPPPFGSPFRPGFQPAPMPGRFGAPGYPQNNPAAANGLLGNIDPNVLLDRTTNEDRREDWEMKVVLIVLVDPTAPAAPAGAPTPPSP